MKDMDECDIRLNEFGEPDVAYYIARARAERAAVIRGLAKDFLQWLGGFLHKPDFHFGRPTAHH